MEVGDNTETCLSKLYVIKKSSPKKIWSDFPGPF